MFRLQIKIWHLFVVIAVIAVIITLAGRLGFETGFVIVDEYYIQNKDDEMKCELHIKYHFESPASVAGTSVNSSRYDILRELVRTDIESGQRIEFRFRARAYLGQEIESPEVRFSRELFAKPKTRIGQAELAEIFSDYEPSSW